jgi:hypothetical protein
VEGRIGIHYDMAVIPGMDGARSDLALALDFRTGAMDLIGCALEDRGLGEWAECDLGRGEVGMTFLVRDLAAAEATVRETVRGTRFEAIGRIARTEAPFQPPGTRSGSWRRGGA